MAKSPTGNRPRPTVAKDHSPSFNTDNTGRKRGASGTKSPTGSRPTPTVAKGRQPSSGVPAAPSYPKRTPMPAPKQRWGKRGGGKPHGGN